MSKLSKAYIENNFISYKFQKNFKFGSERFKKNDAFCTLYFSFQNIHLNFQMFTSFFTCYVFLLSPNICFALYLYNYAFV